MNIFSLLLKPFTDRIEAWKDRHEPARSANGWLIITHDGVAYTDYSSPAAQSRQKYLIENLAAFDTKTQSFKGYYMQRRSHIDQIRQQINEYLANPANASKMLYLDTETTGLGDTDQAISIAIIDEDLTVIVDTRLMTTVDINPEAQKIHKISKGDLLEYPYFVDIEHDIKRLLDGRQVGIYNADFDTRILRQSASYGMTFNFKPFCVMKEAMMLLTKNDRWLKLVDACKLTGVTLDNAHDALADAIATAKVHAVLKEMDEHIF